MPTLSMSPAGNSCINRPRSATSGSTASSVKVPANVAATTAPDRCPFCAA